MKNGFSLIEVLIVIAIIGGLSAIAIPAYSGHICKMEKNQAKSDLMSFAQALERYYSVNNFTYVGATTAVFSAQSPVDGTQKFGLSIASSSKSSFSLLATKTAGSCDSGLAFTLDSAGSKSSNWND